jgi:putative ABC transport system permease protein
MSVLLRCLPFVGKQAVRRPARSILTVLGVATAAFLFGMVQSLQAGVREATGRTAKDRTLVVYRENRFCPFTSRLPEDYARAIAAVPGVARVTPVKILVSNCRASLDVVTFRGVPAEAFAAGEAAAFRLLEGSLADWTRRTDAALVGATLAARRGLRAGDRFSANGTTVTVAAVFESDEAQDRDVAYVHLPFLQRTPGGAGPGLVTQFNVRVDDPARMDAVAAAVDAEFRTAREPTTTRSEKAFVARAAGDVMELVGFTRWLGLGCVLAVLALVANAVILSVQDRVRDFAVMQTLGFTGREVGALVVLEGTLLSAAGGILGVGASAAVLGFGSFSLANEGLSIPFAAGPSVWALGPVVFLLLGALAGAVPAWRAARVELAASFRAV